MRRDPDPEDYDAEQDPREPIDLAGLNLICKSHKHGAALLAVGKDLIARGLEIYLLSRERNVGLGSVHVGYWYQGDWEGSVPEWFTCLLRSNDFI